MWLALRVATDSSEMRFPKQCGVTRERFAWKRRERLAGNEFVQCVETANNRRRVLQAERDEAPLYCLRRARFIQVRIEQYVPRLKVGGNATESRVREEIPQLHHRDSVVLPNIDRP